MLGLPSGRVDLRVIAKAWLFGFVHVSRYDDGIPAFEYRQGQGPSARRLRKNQCSTRGGEIRIVEAFSIIANVKALARRL